MDDIIQRLVEIDRECVERVEATKARKQDVQTDMNKKRKEIYEGFVALQNEEIAKHKAELMEKNQATKQQAMQDYEDTLVNLENLYHQNKDRWVNEIVERCLK